MKFNLVSLAVFLAGVAAAPLPGTAASLTVADVDTSFPFLSQVYAWNGSDTTSPALWTSAPYDTTNPALWTSAPNDTTSSAGYAHLYSQRGPSRGSGTTHLGHADSGRRGDRLRRSPSLAEGRVGPIVV